MSLNTVTPFFRRVMCFAILVSGSQALAITASLSWVSDVTISYEPPPQSEPLVWSNGRFLAVEADPSPRPVIRVFDDRGQQVMAVSLDLPGLPGTKLYSRAISSRGRIAVCGLSIDKNGIRAPFLAQFSPDGASLKVTATAPYHPMLVTFGPDDTVWTVGNVLINGKEDKNLNGVYNVARHFDLAGREIGSALPRSSLNSAGDLYPGGWLTSSSGGIGWYSGEGVNGAAYYEFSDTGRLEKYPGVSLGARGEMSVGFGHIRDGSVYLSTTSRTPPKAFLYTLDRQLRQWTEVPILPNLRGRGNGGILLGGSDDRLAFLVGPRAPISFCRVN